MPFTNGTPVELTPDFTADERLVNSDTSQQLTLRHRTADTYAVIEGSKPKGEAPYYSFIWKTLYSVEDAAALINKADEIEGLGAETGVIGVCSRDAEPSEYGWAREVPSDEDEVGLTDMGLAAATLIRLDANDSTLGWNIGDISEPEGPPRMWVITADSILSPWVQTVYNETIEDKTREVIARNLGTLTAGLTAFMQLPFGECTLDTDFRTQQH